MHSVTTSERHPDAMADVPGICDLPLTRGVVQYRDVHELYEPGGRIRDIGLAVVLSGRFASSARVVDLGSAEAKYLNLTSELVILDWVYEPTLAHLRRLDAAAEVDPPAAASRRRYCFDLALRVLNRRGFSSLTRPVLLRIGFRDLCQDLDLHEETVVRIITGAGETTRVHLDYETNTLIFRTARRQADDGLEAALALAFPGLALRRTTAADADGFQRYHLRLGIPATFRDLQESMRVAQRGLMRMVARFEPERYREVRRLVSTFGTRATLDRLTFAEGGEGRSNQWLGHSPTSVH